MRIGILLPTVLASSRFGKDRIFAPGDLAIKLADRLVEKGHSVYLYTSQDIKTKATIVAGDANLTDRDLSYFQFRNRDEAEQRYSSAEIIKRDFEYGLTLQAYQDALDDKLDIIHSYHDFGAHYFNELTMVPTVYTLHDPVPQSEDTIEYHRFKRFQDHLYVSISDSQRRGVLPLNFISTVYHGIDLSAYDFSPNPSESLIHFGRIMEDKGSDIAIQVAKTVGMPLMLATSMVRANRSQSFFDEKIAPFVDGTMVQAVGFLQAKEKSAYIGQGKAFLFPLQWEEPFGMVMIESMACGTPVIAYNRGSVSEIVQDGVTGFIVDPDGGDRPNKGNWVIKKQGVEGLVEAIKRIGEIDRSACKKLVEEKFTVDTMTRGYEQVYESILVSTK